jgi:beta-lactamase class A
MLTRRTFTTSAAMAGIGIGLDATLQIAKAETRWPDALTDVIGEIERKSSGRLGVSLLDMSGGASVGHRASERFPMCSTFKVLAAGALLARIDAGREQLSRRIQFTAADLQSYSPGTKDRVGGEGMMLSEICEAALTLSDNTAANLLLDQIGGTAGMTNYARSIGDETTRLDRTEPSLNEAVPGDPRDTTTPTAMVSSLKTLTFGDALSAASRAQLLGWLKRNKTGAKRLRAGLPQGWLVGDKTGSGDHGTANDIGVIWPPDRQPILVAVYLTSTTASFEDRESTIAAVGRSIATHLPS